jgi:GSCFA family
MSTPYRSLPSYTRWSKALASLAYDEVDPVTNFPFRLQPSEKVATAGSCFAQHIARHLSRSGFNYYVAEPGHPLGEGTINEEFGYGVFSARYGNLYTAAQLLQTGQRAFGMFYPTEDIWALPEGGFADPFRPAIQPGGFPSREELMADREQHLAAIRRMFETLDVFVFTLGLTEAWRCRSDGAVLPVCPGVHGGIYSDDQYEFVNFGFEQVLKDMKAFLHLLRSVNPSARVILTVSPVPLIATAENRHVLVSTTYSKSVLRTVCEELVNQFDWVAYFPSFEIITGSYTRGRYFAEDLRSVTEEGVQHVMRLFLKHATDGEVSVAPDAAQVSSTSQHDDFTSKMRNVVNTICEEELIELSLR